MDDSCRLASLLVREVRHLSKVQQPKQNCNGWTHKWHVQDDVAPGIPHRTDMFLNIERDDDDDDDDDDEQPSCF